MIRQLPLAGFKTISESLPWCSCRAAGTVAIKILDTQQLKIDHGRQWQISYLSKIKTACVA